MFPTLFLLSVVSISVSAAKLQLDGFLSLDIGLRSIASASTLTDTSNRMFWKLERNTSRTLIPIGNTHALMEMKIWKKLFELTLRSLVIKKKLFLFFTMNQLSMQKKSPSQLGFFPEQPKSAPRIPVDSFTSPISFLKPLEDSSFPRSNFNSTRIPKAALLSLTMQPPSFILVQQGINGGTWNNSAIKFPRRRSQSLNASIQICRLSLYFTALLHTVHIPNLLFVFRT
jgi:hypothetical protein